MCKSRSSGDLPATVARSGPTLHSLAPDAMAGGTGLEKSSMPVVWPSAKRDGHLKRGERRLPIVRGGRLGVQESLCPRPQLGVFLIAQLLEPIGVDLGRRQCPRFQGAYYPGKKDHHKRRKKGTSLISTCLTPKSEFRTFLGLKVTANAAGPTPPDFFESAPTH